MSRVISLIVLCVFVILFAGLFFWVMARFVLPLFLAALLAVLFKPLHRWFTRQMAGYTRFAAVATTVTILLIVLLPVSAILTQAVNEVREFAVGSGGVEEGKKRFVQAVTDLNARFGLELDAERILTTAQTEATTFIEPLALKTPGWVGGFLIGIVVMIVALYYFLVDGDDMIVTIARLLPLDIRYQQQILTEFDKVSRAVVAATVVTAIVQGLLAGIAYRIAGLGSVFLLMMLTMLGSMIPFVGAAAVWVSATLWLFFVVNNIPMAIFMLVCGIGISTIDNLIKPIVLHGQSNLHPLLALLSILGGVQALGPLGIFVGPMAVAFLQAGLNMLHSELGTLKDNGSAANVAG